MASKVNKSQGPIRAFLGSGTEFEGLLNFEGTVRIDGNFKGEIKTNDCLIIGETALIEAEINVGHLIVMGKISGNIISLQKVEITSSGNVKGDVMSPILIIQEGAILEGNVRMEDENKKVVNIDEARSATEAAG